MTYTTWYIFTRIIAVLAIYKTWPEEFTSEEIDTNRPTIGQILIGLWVVSLIPFIGELVLLIYTIVAAMFY